MSTQPPRSDRTPRRRDPTWAFFAVAGLIYALAAVRGGCERQDPNSDPADVAARERLIVVDGDVRRALEAGLEAQLGRAPEGAERESALRHWIDQEILVREALAIGLERDDPVVRARLAERMAFVVGAGAEPDAVPDEATLRALYEASEGDLVVPGAMTVEQLFFGADEAATDARRAALDDLRGAEPVPPEALAGVVPPPGGPVLRNRRLGRLVETHGPAFAEAVASAPLDVWVEATSSFGLHLVRVRERRPDRALELEEVRDRLVARWQRERAARATERALDALRRRYVVEERP